LPALNVIDPVARAEIDLHFDNTAADASRFAGIPFFQAINPRQNLRAA
jgi:hypothetical protein